jgi:hypothetical protein
LRPCFVASVLDETDKNVYISDSCSMYDARHHYIW